MQLRQGAAIAPAKREREKDGTKVSRCDWDYMRSKQKCVQIHILWCVHGGQSGVVRVGRVEAAVRAHRLGRARDEVHEVVRGESHDPTEEVRTILRIGDAVLQGRDVRVDGVIIRHGERGRRCARRLPRRGPTTRGPRRGRHATRWFDR
jgi:hypothetical protein